MAITAPPSRTPIVHEKPEVFAKPWIQWFQTLTGLTSGGGGGGSTPNFADQETPTGAINGSNLAYTLAHAPNPAGSLQLYRDGVLMQGGGADYSLGSTNITIVDVLETGERLLAWYRY